MKRAATIKLTDVILSVGTLALVLLAVVVVAVTGSMDEFVAWAWERHHNVLSWYIRPLFFLPFCYFAYRRSLFGITLTLVALATSIFWFPAPETASPAVIEMLAAERDVSHRRLDALEGPRRLADPDLVRRPRPGLLETVARLGAGGHQRGDPDQDRVDIRLQHRSGRHVAPARRRAGPGGLRRGDPVRPAQDAPEAVRTSAAGGSSWLAPRISRNLDRRDRRCDVTTKKPRRSGDVPGGVPVRAPRQTGRRTW